MTFYKHIYSLFIATSLFGYALSAGVSEMLAVSADSSIVSIIFRSFTLILTLVFILNILKYRRVSNIFELYILTLFLSFYSFRMYYDFNLSDIYIQLPKSQYYIFYYLTLRVISY